MASDLIQLKRVKGPVVYPCQDTIHLQEAGNNSRQHQFVCVLSGLRHHSGTQKLPSF